jgi:predicted ATP-dependent serine protease
MAKIKKAFVCQSCGANYPQWSGQCRACEQWNSIVEAQNKVLARLTEVEEMIRVHHIAFTDMLSTTEQLSDVRQQILAANAAFYAANREKVARKVGN